MQKPALALPRQGTLFCYTYSQSTRVLFRRRCPYGSGLVGGYIGCVDALSGPCPREHARVVHKFKSDDHYQYAKGLVPA